VAPRLNRPRRPGRYTIRDVQLSAKDALALRMTSLLLRPESLAGPGEVAGIVEWFGAMQAQDLASVQWSLGVRLPGFTEADVIAALERREALRTWPMRGTVHLIPPADAHWMLDLMGVRALDGSLARREQLGLKTADAEKAVEVLGAALTGGNRLTRSQCLATLNEAGIDTKGQIGYHLLWYASQRGVTCIAPNIGKEQSFVLLDEWAGHRNTPDRDEALGLIATRFFRSHGPAARKDFAGWTGLTMTDAKRGIAAAGAALTPVHVDDGEMFVTPEVLDAPRTRKVDVKALPGFDEYLLGYKDRALMVAEEHKQAIIPGGNGVFQATIVREGRVVATWKRRLAGRNRVVVDVCPLGTVRAAELKKVLRPYAEYLGRELEVTTAAPADSGQ
jgi:hypothetical protein